MPRLTKTAAFAIALVVILLPSYWNQVSAQEAGAQTVVTGAGELTVELDISFPERKEVATVFTITFSDPATDEVEEHIYYDFWLMKDGRNIFRASTYGGAQIGVIHSVTGIEKQFFTFSETGSYTASVFIYGLRMVLVEPVAADFPVTVTPEFQVVMPVLALAASGILFMRFGLKKPRFS